jgi:hypothetical protein
MELSGKRAMAASKAASFDSVTLIASVLLLVTAAFTNGCQHKPASAGAKNTDSVWQGFGTPGPGKIAVTIVGEVGHPGRYFLEQGASLQSVLLSAGGLIRKGGLSTNEHIAPHVAFVRRTKDNEPHKTTYPIARMSGEELDSVKLQDGDTVEYPRVIF